MWHLVSAWGITESSFMRTLLLSLTKIKRRKRKEEKNERRQHSAMVKAQQISADSTFFGPSCLHIILEKKKGGGGRTREKKDWGHLNIRCCLLWEEKKAFQFVLSELSRSEKHTHMQLRVHTHAYTHAHAHTHTHTWQCNCFSVLFLHLLIAKLHNDNWYLKKKEMLVYNK